MPYSSSTPQSPTAVDRYQTHRFCIAPMIDWTDKHCRYFHRKLTQSARLYTEMITTGAIIHGDRERHLRKHDSENVIALQLGGSDPYALNQSIQIANAFGYDEYNLNVGCPSDRVQSGRFGACLMREANLVADCVKAMQDAAGHQEVTVKCRTGIDNDDSFEFLVDFIGTVNDSACETFIIHARKAWLSGLSPKENREIPPLHYERVHKIKQLFPTLNIIINGGLLDLGQAGEQLEHCDGVMFGRAAYNNPWLLTEVDQKLFDGKPNTNSRHAIIESMLPYIEQELSYGARLHHITRHMLGLFNGMKGAKQYRRYLSEHANQKEAGIETLITASQFVISDQG